MAFFKRKPVPGSVVLPEPRLETAAVEHAIFSVNSNVIGNGDFRETWAFLDSVDNKLDSFVKSHEERQMINHRSSYLQEQMRGNRLCTLYARFDIDKINSGSYGETCYKVVFRTVPHRRLLGCMLLLGDSQATLRGRENVCVIGFWASLPQLELISQSLSKSLDFKSVCANDPLQLCEDDIYHDKEPIVPDGFMTIDGIRIPEGEGDSTWAKITYDNLKQNGELAT